MIRSSTTYHAKPSNVTKTWHVVDATNLVLGRMASQVAKILRGKNKPIFTPHINTGDSVIVINAEKIAVTGKKLDQDIFYWHTGYPGGIKEMSKGTMLTKKPTKLIEKAIERMMPKDSPLARKQMKNLYIYAGSEHPHSAQNPTSLDIAAINKKNKR